eukprot:scaffold310642_cov19-Tisochrysis_lutea.AAC.2
MQRRPELLHIACKTYVCDGDALVKRLETHLVERERANDSLKETVRRLEARLKKSEQQQNTPGLEA